MMRRLQDAISEPEHSIAKHLLLCAEVMNDQPPRAGRVHRSQFHVLLEHGRFWTPALRPKGLRQRPGGRCFRNSANLLRNHPEWHYCEGYAVLDGLEPLHHGWLADDQGQAVDPTWKNTLAYFGVVMEREHVLACQRRKKGMNAGLLDDWIHGSPLLAMTPETWLPKSGPYAL